MKRILLLTMLAGLWLPAASSLAGTDVLSQRASVTSLNASPDHAIRPIEAGSLALSLPEVDSLIAPGRRAVLSLPSIDRFTGNEETPLRFRPVQLFASGSQVRIVTEKTQRLVRPAARQYYLAGNSSTGIGLAVDPETGEVSGFATKGGERMQISGNFASRIEFAPVEEPPAGAASCGNGDLDMDPGLLASGLQAGPRAESVSAAELGSTISFQAVVAIDTDSEWLAGFGNDEAAALQWITDIFLAMNVFYERDVETQLLIGEVILRTGSDPYSEPSDRFAQLNEFGQYWMNNMGSVERQFAAMFSGRGISAGGFSGIAWIGAYCNNGYSYSYNAIGSSRTAANTAIYVGHELGHNMGSRHTHCYNPAVDHCFNAESGCYSGPPECPAGGKGTIMSYCHYGPPNGAGCGTSLSEFHPTVQANLENHLADELAAGCILPYVEPPVGDLIFKDGLEQ